MKERGKEMQAKRGDREERQRSRETERETERRNVLVNH